MSSIHDLKQGIEEFLSGPDHSCTPRLRELHKNYREQSLKVEEQLQKCNELVAKGMLADARALNNSFNPSLTERIRLLSFPRRQEFLDLCTDYDLPAIPAWDQNLLDALEGKTSHAESRINELIIRWRRFARTGHNAEKIQLLRELLKVQAFQTPEWKKNLAEAEQQRYAEIAEEIPRLTGTADELEALEHISQELYSPLLLTQPKQELLNQLQQQMFPLQKQRCARQLEHALDEVQAAYADRDIPRLRAKCEAWNKLSSSPLAEIQPSQRQTIDDALNFLKNEDEKTDNKKHYEELYREITALLESNAPYAQIAPLYEMLQRTGLDIPQVLIQQITALRQDAEAQTIRLHRRHCVYGICIALMFLVLTGIAIHYIQYYLQVKDAIGQQTLCLREERFQDGLDFFAKLEQIAPKVATHPKVADLQVQIQNALQNKEASIKAANEEFTQLESTLQDLFQQQLLENTELDKILQRGEDLKPLLTEENKKHFIQLQQAIIHAKDEIRKNREKAFANACKKITDQIASAKQRLASDEKHEISLEACKKSQTALRQDLADAIAESKVDAAITRKQRDHINKQLDQVDYLIGEEERFRTIAQNFTQPANIEQYLKEFEGFQGMPEELRFEYNKAYLNLKQWQIDVEDAALTAKGDAVSLAEQLKRYGTRSLFLQEAALHRPAGGINPWPGFQNEIDKFDCFELVFHDSGNVPYYFYSKTKPELEWDSRYKGQLWNLITYIEFPGSSAPQLAIFHYNPEDGSFTNRMAAFRKAWKTPPEFIKLDGWNLTEPQFRKSQISPLLQQISAAPKNQEKVLLDILAKLDSQNMNPVVELSFIHSICKVLADSDAFFRTRLEKFATNLAALAKDLPEWQVPAAAASRPGLDALLKQQLHSIDWGALRKERLFQNALQNALQAHHLIPKGVLKVHGKHFTAWTFDQKPPREMLVLHKKKLHKLYSTVKTGDIEPQDKEYLYTGQIIWGYPDAQSCQDLLEYWRRRADDENLSMQIVSELCPEELLYFLK